MATIAEKIYDYLVDKILKGEYQPGDRLPTETQLSELFKTSRSGAHRAHLTLEEMGITTRNKRRGSVLAKAVTPAIKRELLSRFTKKVFLVVDHDQWHTWTDIHWDITSMKRLDFQLHEQGINFEILKVDFNDQTAFCNTLHQAAEGMGILGLVLSKNGRTLVEKYEKFIFRHFRDTVLINLNGDYLGQTPFNILEADNIAEGVVMGELLVDKGFVSIVYWVPSEKMSTWGYIIRRLRGVALGVERASDGLINMEQFKWPEPSTGEPVDIDYSLFEQFSSILPESYISAVKLIKSIMEGQYQTCPAIVTPTDGYAAFFIESVKKFGAELGRDYTIAGFGDDKDYLAYNLTTVPSPKRYCWETLSNLFVQLSNNSREASQVTRLSTNPIERQSLNILHN